MKKFIGWLIVLAIFSGFGYLIYQNGGIPEDGFNVGELIGVETPDGLEFISINGCGILDESEMDQPFDYDVVNKLSQIDSAANHKINQMYSCCYHVDSQFEETNSIENQTFISTITGIDDYENVIGVASSELADMLSGAYIGVLIEFKPDVDAIKISEKLNGTIDPKTWSFGSEEYITQYNKLSPDNIHFIAHGNYLYVIVLSPELEDDISIEKLKSSFYRTIAL